MLFSHISTIYLFGSCKVTQVLTIVYLTIALFGERFNPDDQQLSTNDNKMVLESVYLNNYSVLIGLAAMRH